ncbi:MAG TPA: 2Fe-2S iron-sulfur cluster-binding protein [Stellaceae bacterium]|nr:2Fe-2S iron-sulfur cluster-binding protein [Stellaceae bacterium]
MVQISFVSRGITRTIDARGGLTLMEAAVQNGIEGIDAECGGACSCATCHVYVDAVWLDRTGSPDDFEAGMLEAAVGPRANSRLSCQIKLSETLDGLVVEVPAAQT